MGDVLFDYFTKNHQVNAAIRLNSTLSILDDGAESVVSSFSLDYESSTPKEIKGNCFVHA